MASMIIPELGYALALLTLFSSSYAAWRDRETYRLDIFGLVLLITVKPLHELLGPVSIGLHIAQAYFLLRLVHHFREVPRALLMGTLACAAIGTALYAVWPQPHPVQLTSVTWAGVTAVQVFAAVAFTGGATRSSGVTAKRRAIAAVGTYLFAATLLLATTGQWFPDAGRVLSRIGSLLTTGMLACYYVAFATPRWLRIGWQRAEQARYLSLAADLDPEERGTRTAQDLSRAAASASGNAAALVLLRSSLISDELIARASSQPTLTGLTVTAGSGLVGEVLRDIQPIIGRPDACEPALAERLRPFGVQVLVAPIATTTHAWGVVLIVQRRGSLFPDDDLRLLVQLGKYAGTALDHAQLVTEARERERKAADRRLREAESRTGLMLDNIRDYAMYVLDHRGCVVTWHAGAQHVFGYRAEEMADELASTLYSLTEPDFLRLLGEARALGRVEFERQCRRRDGAIFIGLTTITPLAGDDDHLRGFVGVTRDVTEQRDLEQRLRQSQKMDAIGRLAGGIAHDFNNLLTAMMGYADLLASDFRHDEEHRQPVEEIQNAAQRAASLTRQLLAFSRQQVFQPAPINLSRLVVDLLPMLKRLIGEHITIIDDTDSEICAVMGDRSQLEQVIINLAVNARDAMPAGGTLTIRTTRMWLDQSSAAGDVLAGLYALLEVRDTGIGMDAATQARIFEPFFTTKEFGRGTGLGLATVYGIVKQMGGAVRVDSTLQEGTTFRLYFPETRSRETAAFAATTAHVPRGSETVLLVEDETSVRSFLTQVLERQGYHVQVRPGTPALYISGYADAVLAAQGAFPKASHFLQKPFSTPELLTRIRQILSRP